MALDRVDEAAQRFETIVALVPRFHPAWINLGVAAHQVGDSETAAAHLRTALEIKPDDAGTYFRLGGILQEQGELDGAIECYRQGLAHDAENARAWFVLGDIHNQLGDIEKALAAYRRAVALRPDDLSARWRALLSLPIVYRTPAEIETTRDRYRQGLREWTAGLDDGLASNSAAFVEVLGSYTNFYLPYQGYDDTDLQEMYGGMLQRVAGTAFPNVMARSPRGRDRRRIGFVSANLHDSHTIRKLFAGWMQHLDRTTFEVHAFYLGDKGEDDIREVGAASDRLHFGWSGTKSAVERIAGMELDALIYPDIGMSPRVQLLSALRLAPVQCVSWGHPVTTGLDTIDFFLSSDLMEPAHGERHYREKLVRLPNLSIHYTETPLSKAAPPGGLDLQDEIPTFLCTQSLYKLLPQFDDVYPRIVKAAGPCRFWFIRTASLHATRLFEERLKRAFAAYGLRSEDFCRIFPHLNQNEFLGLNLAADVVLDSFLWSGGNTSLEAFACGKPVVTLPGPMMRGRHTSAMLERMEIPDLIAQDIDDYISIAIALIRDDGARREASTQVSTRKSRLFDDRAPVDALGAFLMSQMN